MRVLVLEVRERNGKLHGKYEVAQPAKMYVRLTVLAAPHDTGRISKLDSIAAQEWEARQDTLLKDFAMLYAETGIAATGEHYVILHLARQGMFIFTQTHVPIRYEP